MYPRRGSRNSPVRQNSIFGLSARPKPLRVSFDLSSPPEMLSFPVFLDRLPASILTLVSLLLLAPSGSSQVPDAIARTIISSSTVNESSAVSMGRHVAMDGNVVVTSARFASIGAQSAGVVKVFDSTT